MKSFTGILLGTAALGLVFVSGASAADNEYAYPVAGHVPGQQAQGRFECHTWAINQSGFDRRSQNRCRPRPTLIRRPDGTTDINVIVASSGSAMVGSSKAVACWATRQVARHWAPRVALSLEMPAQALLLAHWPARCLAR